MYLIRFIFNVIFFKNPIIILFLSFGILYLAGLLNSQIDGEKHGAQLALTQGPPQIIDINSYSSKEHRGPAREINVRAEIDLSDRFKFTVVTNGVHGNVKIIVPLYAPTQPSTDHLTALLTRIQLHKDQDKRRSFNKASNKTVIGAIVLKNAEALGKLMDTMVRHGQIGPIITVNGQQGSFYGKHLKMAEERFAKLNINYVKNPVYIKAFFGNRTEILQNQVKNGAQSNPLYIMAYLLMLISFIRCIWQITALAKGQKDASLVHAILSKFAKRTAASKTQEMAQFNAVPAFPTSKAAQQKTAKTSDPFNRLNTTVKPSPLTVKPSPVTVRRGSGSLFTRKPRII